MKDTKRGSMQDEKTWNTNTTALSTNAVFNQAESSSPISQRRGNILPEPEADPIWFNWMLLFPLESSTTPEM